VNVGDLVGIQWKAGIGYVGSKTGEFKGLILEKHPSGYAYIVYTPKINRCRVWGETFLVRLKDEV